MNPRRSIKCEAQVYVRTRNERLANLTESLSQNIGIGAECAIDVQSEFIDSAADAVSDFEPATY